MQVKNYNSYKITHKNGNVEEIIAEDLITALQNMEISEETSPVITTVLTQTGVRTLVEDAPDEISFTCIASDSDGGSIVTPASGVIHVGDEITLQAVPARNYEFVSWSRNGKVISESATVAYTMVGLAGDEATAIFTATFRLAPVAYTTLIPNLEAEKAGCIAFPESGTVDANSELALLAVPAEDYEFVSWTRNGTVVSTDAKATVKVTPLAEDETKCVYTANFNHL